MHQSIQKKDLPVELWEIVFRHLCAQSLMDVLCVSRRWRAIAAASPVQVHVALVVTDESLAQPIINTSWQPTVVELVSVVRSRLPAMESCSSDHRHGGQLWVSVRVGYSDDGLLPQRAAVLQQVYAAAQSFTGRERLQLILTLWVDAMHDPDLPFVLAAASAVYNQDAINQVVINGGEDHSDLGDMNDTATGNGSNINHHHTNSNRRRLLCNGFQQAAICNPLEHSLYNQPRSISYIEMLNIHSQVDLGRIGEFLCLKSIRMQSDGRLLDERGIFRVSALLPLNRISVSLTSLTLDGPWFQTMIDFGPGLIDTLKHLTCLKRLYADFDAPTLTPQALYSLFTALPLLNDWGSLGRVDKSFWRLFRRGEAARLTRITVGTCKHTFSSLLTGNRDFLPDLVFGLLWAAPSLAEISLFLGYQTGTNMDMVLEMVQRLKEGKNWDVELARQRKEIEDRLMDLKLPSPPEYSRLEKYTLPHRNRTQLRRKPHMAVAPVPINDKPFDVAADKVAITPVIDSRALRRVNIFQAIDVSGINSTAWNYTAWTHAGGSPISIIITDDTSIDGSLGVHFQKFGPVSP
ncbi:hypothetical protein BASA50_005907 [Batrachochytrium salamandrivorans]|uniref:F-box domain-containing protein n=1 Tax=Batrachochytrium salamandrivorans TaxID=1357716 RepID=A0ABQ8FBJ4_9FUNG|nr:hypothetical protein BASA61_009418 [Batrachochytrium salamandrivorans]KAH6595389.1 hypothetical protein BASA50_005907 [Batrachochytrium salamandrivorans]KAH9247377.1 hypothetical protein BASA81_015040 [Batrachochytrium salamandrivorans]